MNKTITYASHHETNEARANDFNERRIERVQVHSKGNIQLDVVVAKLGIEIGKILRNICFRIKPEHLNVPSVDIVIDWLG